MLNLPRWCIGWDETAERELVVHLWEPFVVFEADETSSNLKMIAHRIKPDDMDALLLARLAREAGEAYVQYQNGGIKRSEYRTAIGYDSGPEDELYIQDIYGGGQGDTQKIAETAKMMREIKRRSRESREVFETIQAEL